MPGRDRTGPWGQGPQTGRQAGECGDFEQPLSRRPRRGRGLAWGWGHGRRASRFMGAAPERERTLIEEVCDLQSRIAFLQQKIDTLERKE